MLSSSASVPTSHASTYLQHLCKHWLHYLQVEFDADTGSIVLPRDARGADWPGDARIVLRAKDKTLECRIDASAPRQLEGLKGVLARHVDRFAFREAPLRLDWTDA